MEIRKSVKKCGKGRKVWKREERGRVNAVEESGGRNCSDVEDCGAETESSPIRMPQTRIPTALELINENDTNYLLEILNKFSL